VGQALHKTGQRSDSEMSRSEEFIRKRRRSIAWMLAYLECVSERRPVCVIKTEMQLRGLLL